MLAGWASPAEVRGRDLDAALDFGLGVEFNLTRSFTLGVDVRDVVSETGSGRFGAHSLEAVLDLSFTLSRAPGLLGRGWGDSCPVG